MRSIRMTKALFVGSLGLLLGACSVAEYRKMYFPAFRPVPPATKIQASVRMETETSSTIDKNMAEAFGQVATEDLAALFTGPVFEQGKEVEFVLKTVLKLEGVFPPTTVDVTTTLLDPRTGETVVSFHRSGQDSSFVGDVRMREVANVLVQSVVQALKQDLAKAFESPEVLAKRRWRTPDLTALLQEAEAAHKEADYGKVLISVREAIQKSIRSPEAYLKGGETLLLLCDTDGAVRLAEEGLKWAPEDGGLKEMLERARLGGEGNSGDSSACGGQALNREGVLLAREGRSEMALGKFREAVEAAPGLVPKAHYNAGLVLERMGRAREAMEQYIGAYKGFLLPGEQEEALERLVGLAKRAGVVVPEGTDRKYRIGIVRSQQKRYREAVEQFEAALEEAPWLVEAYYNLGLVYDLTGSYQEALRVFRIYSKLSPQASNIGQVKTKIVELEDKLGLLNESLR